MSQKVMREIVLDEVAGYVIMSKLEPVTEEEIAAARQRFAETGECDHSLVSDDPGWLYDARYCAICGKGLGTV